MDNDLQFKGGNPGAVQYGNFINYYKFHPPNERISLFPKDVWGLNKPTAALDIGCNTGDLTIDVKKFIDENLNTSVSFLAIDIDPILIKRALEVYSDNSIVFRCLNIMDNNQRDTIENYLKLKNLANFSITFCFSVTMWIHLNHGDDGLKKFLKYVASKSDMLLIEPQPWKCYKTAVKRMKQQNYIYPHFELLKIKQNVEEEIEKYLLFDCGLIKISESDKTKWDRKLLVFKQPTISFNKKFGA